MVSFPYINDLNPDLSVMIENALRSNPAFSKKAKDHIRPTRAKYRHTKQSSDSAELSGDMLGDMDPDEYRERDYTSHFQEHIKKWQKKSEKERKEKVKKEEKKNPLKEPLLEAKAPPQKESIIKVTPSSEEEEEENEKEEKKQEILPDDQEATEEEEEETIDIPISPTHAPVKKWEHKVEEEAQLEEDTDVEVEISPPEEEEPVIFEQKPSEFISLLSSHEGFIIVDQEYETIQTPSNISPPVDTPLEDKTTPSEISEKDTEKIFTSLIHSESKELFNTAQKELLPFGIKVLKMCCENLVKVLIIPRQKKISDYLRIFKFKAPHENIRWGYDTHARVVFIGEETLKDKKETINTLRLYFAFAFDHALGGEEFASEKSPAVLSNFNACLKGNSGHQFIDSFCATSPAHYFARCTEAYLLPQDSTSPHEYVCTREDLYNLDRPMYTYIHHLFQKFR